MPESPMRGKGRLCYHQPLAGTRFSHLVPSAVISPPSKPSPVEEEGWELTRGDILDTALILMLRPLSLRERGRVREADVRPVTTVHYSNGPPLRTPVEERTNPILPKVVRST
jgi:hypothetical protein